MVFGVVSVAKVMPAVELQMTYSLSDERITTMQPAKPLQAGGNTLVKDQPKPAAIPRTERQAGEEIVILGKDYFLVEKDGAKTMYNIKDRQVLAQQAGKQDWTAVSLYSDLGFRIMEYQNRVVLGRALAAGGVKDSGVAWMADPFELETLFAMRFPDARGKTVTGLKRETLGDGAWSFRRDRREVVRFMASTSKVPEELRAVFERWLVYTSRIHPDIRRDIVAKGFVPETLQAHWRNTGEEGTTALELKDVVIMEGNTHASAAGLAVVPGPEGPLREVVDASHDAKRRAACPTRESAVKFADEAIASGRALDGFLGLLEITFQSGDDIAADLRSYRGRMEQDQLCKQFFEGMAQSDKASCEHAVKVLRAIDRKDLKKDYILDIHLADALSSLGQRGEAETLFLSVLRRNPFLVGVWNDLGQLYYRGYEMDKAWLCWDVARTICSEHPMLKSITAFERRMEGDFPEFFLNPSGTAVHG